MSIRLIQPEGWAPAKGYANGIAARGTQIFVGGQIGWNAQQQFETDDFIEQAHQISAPTLVVGCTHDQMVPIRHQKALFGAIEDSRFAEIATGHAVVFERPSELTHYVQRFIDAPAEHSAGTIIAQPRP